MARNKNKNIQIRATQHEHDDFLKEAGKVRLSMSKFFWMLFDNWKGDIKFERTDKKDNK